MELCSMDVQNNSCWWIKIGQAITKLLKLEPCHIVCICIWMHKKSDQKLKRPLTFEGMNT